MNEEQIWYFAYGSNLNLGQMMTRIGEWTVSKRAVVNGYKLIFNVKSQRWGGLTANIVRTGNTNAQVYGAVYSIPKEKLNVLTRYEGISPQYVEVEAEGVKIRAKVYVFDTSRGHGTPPDAYLNVMLTGFRQHGYPEEVIETIRKTAINPVP